MSAPPQRRSAVTVSFLGPVEQEKIAQHLASECAIEDDDSDYDRAATSERRRENVRRAQRRAREATEKTAVD